jgi:FHA domain
MSLKRLIYYSAIIGGWSALLGWMVSEFSLNPDGGRLSTTLTCALVGAAIGMGLNLVAGMANARLTQQLKRVLPGLLAGGVGGAVGGYLGDILVALIGIKFRAIGWLVMGAGIGVVEGLYERSPAKLRNGLIGGAVGGLIGGFLFDPIFALMASSSRGMSSRATAFVILGMCIGILIGLVKVVFKDAWLTVLDGYRPGRQLILADAQTVLGRAEYAALPFMGPNDAAIDLVHARIVRQPNGRFTLEDNKSREGTRLNNVRIDAPAILNDGDVIRVGYNSIKFSERHRRASDGAAAPTTVPPKAAVAPPLPPVPTAATVTRPAAPAPPIPAPPQATKPPVPAPAPATKPQVPYAPTPTKPQVPTAAPVQKPLVSTVAPKPAPAAAPVAVKSPPQPAPPAVAPDGSLICPSCKKAVPKGQRYCIVCDMYF